MPALVLDGWEVAERGVTATVVVEGEVVEERGPSVRVRPEALAPHALRLQRAEEALRGGVVMAVPLPAHRADGPVPTEERPVLRGRVLRALVGVADEAGGRAAVPD